MDSKSIFETIDARYPEPSLPGVDHPSFTKTQTVLRSIVNESFYAIFIPIVPRNILSEKSQEYWYRTRTRDVGDLSVLWKTKGGKTGWDASEPGFKRATEVYKEDPSGPFVLGKQVSYGDFVWAGFLLFLKALGEYEDEETGEKVNVWEEFLRRSGGPEVHEALLEAVRPWTEVK